MYPDYLRSTGRWTKMHFGSHGWSASSCLALKIHRDWKHLKSPSIVRFDGSWHSFRLVWTVDIWYNLLYRVSLHSVIYRFRIPFFPLELSSCLAKRSSWPINSSFLILFYWNLLGLNVNFVWNNSESKIILRNLLNKMSFSHLQPNRRFVAPITRPFSRHLDHFMSPGSFSTWMSYPPVN